MKLTPENSFTDHRGTWVRVDALDAPQEKGMTDTNAPDKIWSNGRTNGALGDCWMECATEEMPGREISYTRSDIIPALLAEARNEGIRDAMVVADDYGIPSASRAISALLDTPAPTQPIECLHMTREMANNCPTCNPLYGTPHAPAQPSVQEVQWRKPVDADEGTEMLVKSPLLIDADYNTKGISAGSILPGSGSDKIALCATWCNHQDHYHTTELQAGTFLVRALVSEDQP